MRSISGFLLLLLTCLGACTPVFGTKKAAPMEICHVAIAGSNTIGDALAPKLVEAFLAYNGYPAGPPTPTGENTVRLVGVKGGQTCTVDIRSKGSSTAFEALAQGTAQIGMASRPIKDEEIQALAAAGAGDFAGDAASSEHVIALDGIAIIANPKLKLATVSKADVAKLFLGQTPDWKALGAPAGEVHLYARNDASGTFQFFLEHVLDKDPRWKDQAAKAKRFEGSPELVAAVAADPQGVGFVGAAFATDAVTVLKVSDGGPAYAPDAADIRSEAYPIARRLFVYTRPADYRTNKFVRALVDYMKSPAAYDLIESAHFVSLRTPRAAASSIASACTGDTAETAAYLAATAGAARLPAIIRFQGGSTNLDALGRDDVVRLAGELSEDIKAGARVELIGHSDSAGDAAKNRQLAFERAAALRTAFENLKVFGVQIESAGEMCPVSSNDTEEGRRSNRRVEIWVARKG